MTCRCDYDCRQGRDCPARVARLHRPPGRMDSHLYSSDDCRCSHSYWKISMNKTNQDMQGLLSIAIACIDAGDQAGARASITKANWLLASIGTPVGYVKTTGLINRFKWRFDACPDEIATGAWAPVYREMQVAIEKDGRVFAPVGYATAGLAQLVARYGSYETIVSAHPSHMWEKLPLRLYADVTPGGAA